MSNEANKYHDSALRADIKWFMGDEPYRQDIIKNIDSGDYTLAIKTLFKWADMDTCKGNGKTEAKKILRSIYAMIDNGVMVDDIAEAAGLDAVEKMETGKVSTLLEAVLAVYLDRLTPENLATLMKKTLSAGDIARIADSMKEGE